MRTIPLGLRARKYRGLVALVDDEDYEALAQFRWCVTWELGAQTRYALRKVRLPDGRQITVRMHRQLLNPEVGVEVDHANHDSLDNRRANLRLATSAENHFNQSKQRRATSSVFKGVCWHKARGKWLAQIRFNGDHIHLGLFVDEAEAARAYDSAVVRLFGEFARTNFHGVASCASVSACGAP